MESFDMGSFDMESFDMESRSMEKQKKPVGITQKVGRAVLIAFLLFGMSGQEAGAVSLEKNPNVTWSRDKQAFTTDAGEKSYVAYAKGSSVSTHVTGTLGVPKIGEHYYAYERWGSLPVQTWIVAYTPGNCIHSSYGIPSPWHGISFRQQKCGEKYKCGWNAVCADCGEKLPLLFYMDQDTAESITELPAGLDYYYKCPHCDNLEQGRRIEHLCKKISANQYFVSYDKNAEDAAGYMEESVFYYNNAQQYEGVEVIGERSLRKNRYQRIGYTFTGWNTQADGKGSAYTDGQEVQNLAAADKQTVVLYAQWKTCRSTLCIDPAGGAYQNSTAPIRLTRAYGSAYAPDGAKVRAPSGERVSFVTNGGTPAADCVGKQCFDGWQITSPVKGRFVDGVYTFLGEDGEEDVLQATYRPEEILLPRTIRSGWSFGGWYEDPECLTLAGMPGEGYLPQGSCVLYAKWVNLVLTAKPDYQANDQKGAQDLSWVQADDQKKVYRIYQSRDGERFESIGEEGSVQTDPLPEKKFSYQGAPATWKVASSGFYEVGADGAQGAGVKKFAGGKGGRSGAVFYLEKGDTLTIKVGGSGGYNGGGKANAYGNGGGSTSVVSKRKGTLLIAGGGGGASAGCEGGAGGQRTDIRSDGKAAGEKGDAGGGAGEIGGKGGECVVHVHDKKCYRVDAIQCQELEQGRGAVTVQVSNMHTTDTVIDPSAGDWKIGGHNGGTEGNVCRSFLGIDGVPAEGYQEARIVLELCAEGGNKKAFLEKTDDQYLRISDQNGAVIKVLNRSDLTILPQVKTSDKDYAKWKAAYENSDRSVAWTYQNTKTTAFTQWVKFVDTIALPEGTTALSFQSVCLTNNKVFHYQSQCWKNLLLRGEKQTKICPYQDGEILRLSQSGGGSSFIAGEAFQRIAESGVNAGDGKAWIKALSTGYCNEMQKEDVQAPDLARPDTVQVSTVEKTALDNRQIQIRWEKPADYGTLYYHRVDSYSVSNGEKMCESNVTENTICTGVKGYYYLWDKEKTTEVSFENAVYLPQDRLLYTPKSGTQYLHLAPVDKAGNLGGSIHIPCSLDDEQIFWKPVTEPLSISSLVGTVDYGSVWQSPEGVCYVRADGVTPFALQIAGRLNGPARAQYQIDQLRVRCVSSGQTAQLQIPYGSTALPAQEISGRDITAGLDREGALGTVSYRNARRAENAAYVLAWQGFTLAPSCSGQEITLLPSAGASHGQAVLYSDAEKDQQNGLVLTGDGQAPVISGAEILENSNGRADVLEEALEFNARDDLSGLKDFQIRIRSSLDIAESVLTADEQGRICLDMAQLYPDLTDEFTITLSASDHVGNRKILVYQLAGYGITASLTRILEPHDPVFRCGESGVLEIEAFGRLQKIEVEFPAALCERDPSLNHVYTYTPPKKKVRERLQFMIPLYTEERKDYVILVRGYKEGTSLKDQPCTCYFTVAGSVLSQIRTRLR